jgi:threonyl-tRNA synthetase
MAITVTLPDGKSLELANGGSGADAAAAIGPGLARAALAVLVDGELQDLTRPLPDGARIAIVTERDREQALALIRHDAAHVLAESVLELYPGVKISIGPAIENGFYYDFEFPDGVVVTEHDFPAIEARMHEHVRANEPFQRADLPVTVARERFAAEQQDYKVELIDDLVRDQDSARPLETVSLYSNGPFTDLCRGPHAPSTGRIGAFKLQSVAGAYWRGDSSRTMLTRLYGTAFFTNKELVEYLERLEQARARDHRKLGRELDLFQFSELSPGAPLWKPAGIAIWNSLTELWRSENLARGYQEVRTPIIYDVSLFKESGHWDRYREHMYFIEVESRPMALKPMNCPAHIEIYKDSRHSYRDLPIRYSEAGLVHRHEPSGVLHGLLRVRHITQDDAHIFCTHDQVQEEVVRCLRFGFHLYDLFGFEPHLELSTRPEKRIGTDEMWDRAEAALAGALRAEGLDYQLNPGDGAFYGPKIDLHMTDSIGRSWQLGTIQLDYSMPERFDLTYAGADNTEHRPVMIHRALMGSFERFIGILIEHYGGDFPLWLAPVQALVLPVSERFEEYARTLAATLRSHGLRVECDERNESVSRRIRDAQLRKVNYTLVVGEREARDGTVSVRPRQTGTTGEGDGAKTLTLTTGELTQRLSEEVRQRASRSDAA